MKLENLSDKIPESYVIHFVYGLFLLLVLEKYSPEIIVCNI